jgi:hypothetical protein
METAMRSYLQRAFLGVAALTAICAGSMEVAKLCGDKHADPGAGAANWRSFRHLSGGCARP